MKKKQQQSYLFIFGAVLLLMSFPKNSTEQLRGKAVATLAPLWEQFTQFKLYMQSTLWGTATQGKKSSASSQEEIQRLQLENLLLTNQINLLQELVQQEISMDAHSQQLLAADLTKGSSKHMESVSRLFAMQLQAIPARIIFRSPTSWANSLWVNVGAADNTALGRKAIMKNSPVVVGRSVVGVVDYVGNRQSRVRLLTDSGLTPSVRAMRGQPQNDLLADHLHASLELIVRRPDLFSDLDQKNDFVAKLKGLLQKMRSGGPTWYLAKGELQGSSAPLWRSSGKLLHGVGFNQDFVDEESCARDLRTGKVINPTDKTPSMPILKVHDVLITTGLDGVFPPGLRVAEVVKVMMLREGDYYYEIEAKPTVGNFDDLSLVFILPPTGYDENEKAPVILDPNG